MVIYRRNRQGKAENLLLVADRGSLIALSFPFSCNRRLLLPISFLILLFTVALLPPILNLLVAIAKLMVVVTISMVGFQSFSSPSLFSPDHPPNNKRYHHIGDLRVA